MDDVGIGIEKKSKKLDSDMLKVVAYHESGHALVGYLLKYASSPVKLSIIPRGSGNLGYTQPKDSEDSLKSKEHMIAEIYALLAGRGAEVVRFGKITSGASNDFERATEIIKQMVTRLGMFPGFAPMIYEMSRDSGSCVSEQKRTEIENFVQNHLESMFNNVLDLLEKFRPELDKLSLTLMDSEIIGYDKIKLMFPELEDSVTLKNQ